MTAWLDGTIVARHQWTPQLFSLRIDAALPDFAAGQYVKLALEVDGERLARPYSLVNAPAARPLEIHFTAVPDGSFTSRLAALPVGERVWVSASANGLFTLAQVVTRRHLWLLATGTGLGVYLSMLHTPAPWQRFERIILIHGVRYANELAYAERIAALQTSYGHQFAYAPVISRETLGDGYLAGRITDALVTGALQTAVGAAINPDDSHVMLCGNAEMIKATRAWLETQGLKRHTRTAPGHYTIEQYH